jgi:hypothetical protein
MGKSIHPLCKLRIYGYKFHKKIQWKFPILNLKNICPGVEPVDIIRSWMDGQARPTYNVVFFDSVENV